MLSKPREYRFDDKLKASYGVIDGADISIRGLLMRIIFGAEKITRASKFDDQAGTDYWVICSGGIRISIDVKTRDQDFWLRHGNDDLAIEIWSVVEKQIVGWSRDSRKQAHYILWFWKETGRWCLVPFRMLCLITTRSWQEWEAKYKTATQFTPSKEGGWHSKCVFVPRKEIWRLIYRWFGGESFVTPN